MGEKTVLIMETNLSFFGNGKLMIRVSMTESDFYNKVCENIRNNIANEEAMDVKYVKTGEEVYTDRIVIGKILTGCRKYGYINGKKRPMIDRIVMK